jgi:diguanylate cyclase (GGDEF)-like protein
MLDYARPAFLLASSDPFLLASVEALLGAAGARVEVVLSGQAALAAIEGPSRFDAVLVDADLDDMPAGQLLAAARAESATSRIPMILIAGPASQEWADLIAEGAADDLILRSAEPAYWQLRLDLAMRNHRLALEVESLREAELRTAQLDRLTGIYNRETLLTMLFRETDRVQRLSSPMSLVLFDIDDFGHWNSRLGADACDELLRQTASRTSALLRSYDLLGRTGKDEFLAALPSCAIANAMAFTERLRTEVFAVPFEVSGAAIRLSACFGLAASQGRSPVIVLREAEKALEWAKAEGPETIRCFGSSSSADSSPGAFLSSDSGDDLLAW